MKKYILLPIIFSLLFVLSCSNDEDDDVPAPIEQEVDLLPANFKVDIPVSLSNDGSGKRRTDACGDTICGAELYENLRLFVAIGEQSAEIVEVLINAVRVHNINQAMSLTFTSDDDGREKSLVVQEDVIYNNVTYALCMTISDNNDEAIQLFWNTSPVNGVAILDVYQLDRTNPDNGTLYQIEYAEEMGGYESQMTVSIAGLPENPTDTGYIDNLKMFVGKNGDLLDVYGNTNHPSLGLLFNQNADYAGGVNYAFVARVDEAQDVSVVGLGLPPSTLTDNSTILTTYAVKEVLLEHLLGVFPGSNAAIFEPFISDANPPGYFDNTGFLSGGTVPSNGQDYSNILDLSSLSPFVPNDVRNLSLSFK